MPENTALLFGEFRINQLDAKNWTLEILTDKPKKLKDGTETGENILTFVGYYDTLQSALRSALRAGLKGQGATDAKRIIKRIDEVYAQIDAVVPA